MGGREELVLYFRCPFRRSVKPLIFCGAEDGNQAVPFFGRVVEKDGVVGTLDCGRKIFKAAPIAAPNVRFRNVVTAKQNPITDSRKVDLDILGSDVDKNDFEAGEPSTQHHAQIILPRQRSFHHEAFTTT